MPLTSHQPELAKLAPDERNGARLHKWHVRHIAKWAKKHPKEAASILKEQARYEAASAGERQSILDENNDSYGRAA